MSLPFESYEDFLLKLLLPFLLDLRDFYLESEKTSSGVSVNKI